MMDLKNKKLLIIVESPNKCAAITKYLKNAGYNNVVVMASIGHIIELKDNRSSYKNTGIFPEEDFRMNIAIADDKKDIVKKLKDQVALSDYVFIMTDPDREGEAIAWSLIKFLAIKKDKYFRSVTHEITPKAVVHAIENPITLDTNLVDAAQARLALDKMVGYSISPIVRNYIGAKSAGRCQSAALKIVVDREKEIQNFIPEIYFELFLHFTKNNHECIAKYIGTDDNEVLKLKSEKDINVIKYKCNSDYIIKNINKEEKQESPKAPFTTVTYQQEIANRFGLKVKDAMSIAQKLFEGGYITYMRTDSTDISPEFLTILKEYTNENFNNSFTTPRKGKKSGTEQEGHECLRITDVNLTPEKFNEVNQNNLQQKVYEIIWKRTIASCLPNAKFLETTYTIYNNDQKFKFQQKEILDLGFKKIYKDINEDNSDLVIDNFNLNEILQNCTLESIKKETKPASRYTEASLVAKLKDTGIGRPSTYATIVETVISKTRGYAEIEDKKIVPTEKGIQVSNFLDRAFSNIINLNYTKSMEEKLDLIAENKLNKNNFLQSFYEELLAAINNNKENVQEENNKKFCPLCGSPMIVRRSRFGKLFYGCSKYPECKGIVNIG